MRILYFSRSFIPSHHANSIHVMNMCEALSELGHEVMLICPVHGKEGAEEIFNFYGTKTKFKIERVTWSSIPGKAYFYGLLGLQKVKKFAPDLVISRFLFGTFLCTKSGFPTIHDMHDKDWEQGKIGTKIFKSILSQKSMRKLTFNSNGLLKLFRNEVSSLGSNPDLQVLFNGAKIFSLEDKISLPGNNKLKAGYFGNLYKGRGIELILDVAKQLPQIDFIIVGGTSEDIAFWKNQNPGNNIYFIGFVDPNSVHKYRNAVDILLAPYAQKVAMAGNTGNSADFMNPIKIFEYMSSRKVIVSSELPAIREVLSEKNAVLCPYTIEAWKSALDEISKNPDAFKSRAESSYNEFLQNYSWKARAERMIT